MIFDLNKKIFLGSLREFKYFYVYLGKYIENLMPISIVFFKVYECL